MSASPRISVIVPTKNRPNLLTEAVNSVLSQSMPDFEVIVIDDCSQPPADLAQVSTIADTRLRIERLSMSMGAAAAKNRGVAMSRAPVLAFLDDDDLYRPTYLEQALRALECLPDVDVVFMGVEYFSNCTDLEVPQHREVMSSVSCGEWGQEDRGRFLRFRRLPTARHTADGTAPCISAARRAARCI